MAETVRIEIPVSVKDNTSSGVQSATQIYPGSKKHEKNRTAVEQNRPSAPIRVDADDRASGNNQQVVKRDRKFGRNRCRRRYFGERFSKSDCQSS